MKRAPTSVGDIYKMIGEISVKFATLDFFTILVIDNLGRGKGGPPPNKALGEKFGYLRDVLPANTTNATVLMELRQTIEEAIAVAKLRNRFLHDLLIFNSSLLVSDKVGRVQASVALDNDGNRRGVAWKRKDDVTVPELQDLISRIHKLQEIYNKAARDLGCYRTS